MTPSLFLEQRPHPLPGTGFGLWRFEKGMGCWLSLFPVQYTTAKGTRQEPFDPILNPLGQIGDEVSSLFSTNSSPCFGISRLLPSATSPAACSPPGWCCTSPFPRQEPPAGVRSSCWGFFCRERDRWSAFLHHRFVFLQGVVPLGVVLIVSVVGEQAGFLQPAGQVVGDLHRPEVV